MYSTAWAISFITTVIVVLLICCRSAFVTAGFRDIHGSHESKILFCNGFLMFYCVDLINTLKATSVPCQKVHASLPCARMDGYCTYKTVIQRPDGDVHLPMRKHQLCQLSLISHQLALPSAALMHDNDYRQDYSRDKLQESLILPCAPRAPR